MKSEIYKGSKGGDQVDSSYVYDVLIDPDDGVFVVILNVNKIVNVYLAKKGNICEITHKDTGGYFSSYNLLTKLFEYIFNNQGDELSLSYLYESSKLSMSKLDNLKKYSNYVKGIRKLFKKHNLNKFKIVNTQRLKVNEEFLWNSWKERGLSDVIFPKYVYEIPYPIFFVVNEKTDA